MSRLIRSTALLSAFFWAGLPASSWGYQPYFQPDSYTTGPAYAPYSRPTGIHMKRHASEGAYYLTVYLRNLSPEQLRVNLDRGSLVLRTLNIRQLSQPGPYGGYDERWVQRYHRRIPLPFDADVQKMSVQRQDGSVMITIPRRQR